MEYTGFTDVGRGNKDDSRYFGLSNRKDEITLKRNKGG